MRRKSIKRSLETAVITIAIMKYDMSLNQLRMLFLSCTFLQKNNSLQGYERKTSCKKYSLKDLNQLIYERKKIMRAHE
jgi:hypothetical protein